MNISGTHRINAFIKKNPSSRSAVNVWSKVIREAVWATPADITKTFKHTELVDGFWLFNIAKELKVATKISLQRFPQYDSEPLGDPAIRVLEVMTADAKCDPSEWKTPEEKYEKHRRNNSWNEDRMDAAYERLDLLSADEAIVLRMETFKLADYEYKSHPLPTDKTEPWERLKFLMEENDLTCDDLAKILGESPEHSSEIMDGKRQLTNEQIPILSTHFSVHPTLFGSVGHY